VRTNRTKQVAGNALRTRRTTHVTIDSYRLEAAPQAICSSCATTTKPGVVGASALSWGITTSTSAQLYLTA